MIPERLTKRCGGIIHVFDINDHETALNELKSLDVVMLVGRLTFLEDKIESGEIVELPCKLGDTIFYVQYFCDYKGCSSTYQQFCCGCKEMIEREKRKEKYVICEKSFELKDFEKIDKKYFTTREAAEARLVKLNGGKI